MSAIIVLFIVVSICLYAIAKKADEKADAIWDFLMRRALAAAVQEGWGTINSPFKPTEQARKLFAKLAPELRDYYAKFGRRLTDNQIMFEIEKRWGDKIVKDICIPNNMNKGECLIIALFEAKQPATM